MIRLCHIWRLSGYSIWREDRIIFENFWLWELRISESLHQHQPGDISRKPVTTLFWNEVYFCSVHDFTFPFPVLGIPSKRKVEVLLECLYQLIYAYIYMITYTYRCMYLLSITIFGKPFHSVIFDSLFKTPAVLAKASSPPRPRSSASGTGSTSMALISQSFNLGKEQSLLIWLVCQGWNILEEKLPPSEH